VATLGTGEGRPIFDRPVFIIGCPRSGTTLLFETLAEAPDLWTIGGESHEVIEPLRSGSDPRRWESDRLTAEDADPETVSRLVQGFFSRLRNRDGQRPAPGAAGLRLLEKTPRNCIRIPFLAAAFPDARFVYLFREPRETISSMMDAWRSGRFVNRSLPGWSGPPWSLLLVPGWRELAGMDVAEIAARQWATATSLLLDDLLALDPRRWQVVHFDRLVAEPRTEIERLCAKLDLGWDRALSAPLPHSRSILTPPQQEKWRRNMKDLERVMPLIAKTTRRAHEVAGRLHPHGKGRRKERAPIETRPDSPSLIVISLPRSLSSLMYQVTRKALGLNEPVWTSDGELLNNDRYVLRGALAHDAGCKFTRPTDDAGTARRLFAFLDQTVQPTGFAYKDVVQPFVVSRWLGTGRGLRVLRIRRPILDVALSMQARGWYYPARGRRLAPDDLETALLQGLLEAEAALDAVPAVEVEYDALVKSETALDEALQKLAPAAEPRELRYLDPQFLRVREEQLRRREGDRYQALSKKLEALRRSGSEPAAEPVRRRPRRRKPRVLVVADAIVPTGFARVSHSILSRLKSRYEFHHLGVNYGGGAAHGDWQVYPAAAAGDLFGINRLAPLIEETKPDLVFFINDLWRICQYMPVLAQCPKSLRSVAYFPVDSDPVEPEMVIPLLARIDSLVTYTHFACNETRAAIEGAKQIRPGLPQKDVAVIPHGVDSQLFRPLCEGVDAASFAESRRAARRLLFPDRPDLDDAFIVLNANRNQPRKRIDLTVEAFALFARDKPPGVKLWLDMGKEDVGWDVEVLARRFGISERLMLTSRLNLPPDPAGNRLNWIYNACDVGLNTCSGEGWGLVAFEHAATGAAQVVPRHTTQSELWRDAADFVEPRFLLTNEQILTNAYLVAPEDAAEVLGRLHRDRPHREETAVKCFKVATQDKYSWDAIAERWHDMFRRALTNTPTAPSRSRRIYTPRAGERGIQKKEQAHASYASPGTVHI